MVNAFGELANCKQIIVEKIVEIVEIDKDFYVIYSYLSFMTPVTSISSASALASASTSTSTSASTSATALAFAKEFALLSK